MYLVNLTKLFLSVPGLVAQSVGHLTRKSGVLGSIPGLATYFRFSFRFFKKGSCQLLAMFTVDVKQQYNNFFLCGSYLMPTNTKDSNQTARLASSFSTILSFACSKSYKILSTVIC